MHLAFDFINVVTEHTPIQRKKGGGKKKERKQGLLGKASSVFRGFVYQITEKFASYHVKFLKLFPPLSMLKQYPLPMPLAQIVYIAATLV